MVAPHRGGASVRLASSIVRETSAGNRRACTLCCRRPALGQNDSASWQDDSRRGPRSHRQTRMPSAGGGFHGVGDALGLDADAGDALQQVDDARLVVGEAVGVEASGRTRRGTNRIGCEIKNRPSECPPDILLSRQCSGASEFFARGFALRRGADSIETRCPERCGSCLSASTFQQAHFESPQIRHPAHGRCAG